MHYVFISIKNEMELPEKFEDFQKLKEFHDVRKSLCDCKYHIDFINDLAQRVGIEDLNEYKKEIGNVVYDDEIGKIFMLEDLENYDDDKIESLIQKYLRAQRKARYYLLPLLLRPKTEGYIHKDNVKSIVIGLEILKDEYDLETQMLSELLDLFIHAIECDEEIYCYMMNTIKPFELQDVFRALPFMKAQVQSLGFLGGVKNLIEYKKKK